MILLTSHPSHRSFEVRGEAEIEIRADQPIARKSKGGPGADTMTKSTASRGGTAEKRTSLRTEIDTQERSDINLVVTRVPSSTGGTTSQVLWKRSCLMETTSLHREEITTTGKGRNNSYHNVICRRLHPEMQRSALSNQDSGVSHDPQRGHNTQPH